MFEAIVAVWTIGYIAFANWLNHDKRRMIHRERIAAIEKGIQLPAIEQEDRTQNLETRSGSCCWRDGRGSSSVLEASSR